MPVVSVINYKGGVGKTTVTANIGAELARRGLNVLLIDMDPQASLTFSFVRPERWRDELERERTIKKWFDSFNDEPFALSTLVMKPDSVEAGLDIQTGTGELRLIPSDLGLINVDLELATELGGANMKQNKMNYVRVHRRLADELAGSDFSEFDLILIDCPPNFNIVTKTAIVASDNVLVPAKADYLSTLGIDYLQRSLRELIEDYNEYMKIDGGPSVPISPELLGVVFTMVQFNGGQPINALLNYINQTRRSGVHVFGSYFRENKTHFGAAAEEGVPVVLSEGSSTFQIRSEIKLFVDEFAARVGI